MRALDGRTQRPERMDDPRLGSVEHRVALRGLARLNSWSGSAGALWRPLRELAREAGALRVLDIASGGGDVPVRLWLRARRARLPLRIDGCDASPRAVAFASERAARGGAQVRFFACDVLGDGFPGGYDVYTCSLFLHHLAETDAVRLLGRMASGRALLVSDLVRSRAGLGLAWAATRLLTRSTVVRRDGPLSVRNAFTLAEARRLAGRAGLSGARVAARWPCRLLMEWRR